MNSSLRIIVTGLIAQHYNLGGVAWDYIQYLIGLKNLGHDVWYVEDSGEWPYNFDGGITGNEWLPEDCVGNITYLEKACDFAGLSGKWAYYFPTKSEWYGLSDQKRKNLLETSDLLINISGSIDKTSNYKQIDKRIYIDSDPGFTQIKLKSAEIEFTKRILDHNIHFSFGENLGNDLQIEGIQWHPTRTPIALSCWNHLKPQRQKYTTVMNWKSYKSLQFGGKEYGQKDTELVKFLELPRLRKDLNFEVALSRTVHKKSWASNIKKNELVAEVFESPKDMLEKFGWGVVDPHTMCFDLLSYREYIENSRAEWSIAKGGYVVTKSGWFSCRSACYLAAGKPVIVQDTGFEGIIPTGKGVHSFNTMEDVLDALDRVETDYVHESTVAREIAEEYFNADKVLSNLIDVTYSNSRTKVLTP
jgi:hypothetical protein